MATASNAVQGSEGGVGSPSPTPRSTFELTADAEAMLMAVFTQDAIKQQRMQEHIKETKETMEKLRELKRKRAALLHANAALCNRITGGAGVSNEVEEDENTNRKEPQMDTDAQVKGNTVSPVEADAPVIVSSPPPAPPPAAVSEGIHEGPTANRDVDGTTSSTAAHTPVPEDWDRTTSVYRYGGPAVQGVVTPVFADGMLYRIATTDGAWAFYNDTRHYEMHVHYTLEEAPDHSLRAGPRSSLTHKGDHNYDAVLVVYPEHTDVLVTGVVTRFRNQSTAVLLPKEYAADDQEALTASSANELAAIIAQAGLTKGRTPVTVATANAEFSAEKALQVCRAHRLPFVDPDFVPGQGALFRPDVDTYPIPPLHWRAPSSFLPPSSAGAAALFPAPDSVSTAVIRRGPRFPDTALLSAMAQLVKEKEEVLKCLFVPLGEDAFIGTATGSSGRSSGDHEIGAYYLRLCVAGWWTTVLVDRYLPAATHGPEFARCANDLCALWVPLLEKAYAKALGSYAAILSRSVRDALSDLSGWPSSSLHTLWPSPSVAAPSPDAVAALSKAIHTHLYERHGTLLLCTFPESHFAALPPLQRVALTKTYRDLQLEVGDVVRVRASELVDRHTVLWVERLLLPLSTAVQPRATAGAGDGESWLPLWTSRGKPWASTIAELMEGLGERNSLWIDVEEAAQVFQGGFCFFPTCETDQWTEVRVKGQLTRCDGQQQQQQQEEGVVGSICLCLTVREKTHAMMTLTQTDPEKAEGREGQIAIVQTYSGGDGLRLQRRSHQGVDIFATSAVSHQRVCSAMPSKPVSPRAAQKPVATAEPPPCCSSVSLGMELVPECSPYYVVPLMTARGGGRDSNTALSSPYTLTLFTKGVSSSPPGGSDGASARAVTVRCVQVTAVSPALSAAPVESVVKLTAAPVSAHYQWCRGAAKKVTEGYGSEII